MNVVVELRRRWQSQDGDVRDAIEQEPIARKVVVRWGKDGVLDREIRVDSDFFGGKSSGVLIREWW